MSEILRLEFDAHIPGFLALADTVNEAGVTVVGGTPLPVVKFRLDELDPKLADDFRSVLARLEPLVRARAEGHETSAEALRAQATILAKRQQEFERSQAVAQLESQRLDLEIIAKRAELESLTPSKE